MGEWTEACGARLAEVGRAESVGKGAGAGCSAPESEAESTVFYAVHTAVADEVVEVSSGAPAPRGERRGPFTTLKEAEAALAHLMMGDIVVAFGMGEDACDAAETTAARANSATAAPAVQGLTVCLELASRSTFHVHTTDERLNSTAKLNMLLGQCPEPQLSTAGVDGRPTFDLESYNRVVRWLRACPTVQQIDAIPRETWCALQCYNSHWKEVSQEEVDTRMDQMARFAPRLAKQLLPYQQTGVTSAIRFAGRMLLADDMGLGKTYQALAVAACYSDEWHTGTPLLLVVPCSLRRQWAEELEQKFPQLSPTHIHIIKTTTGGNEQFSSARVVIISYRLLALMGSKFCKRRWGMVIIDESSRMRTSKLGKEKASKETLSCHEAITCSRRAILLSGTPTESRPYELWHQVDALTCNWPAAARPLGTFKAFRNNYSPDEELSDEAEREMRSKPHWFRRRQDPLPKRLFELHVLLRTVCMVRRTKEDVMTELPPKIRRIIELRRDHMVVDSHERVGTSQDIAEATGSVPGSAGEGEASMSIQQACGLQKVEHKDFREMLETIVSRVMVEKGQLIVFAHHHKVMDQLYAQLGKMGIDRNKPASEHFCVTRIDGAASQEEREQGCAAFQDPNSSTKIALISMTAGGQGLNLQAATTIVFAELPPKATLLHQCEARAHRQGQKSTIVVYLVIADHASDRAMWAQLLRSDVRVGRILDGHQHAAHSTMQVDSVGPATALTIASHSSSDCMSIDNSTCENVTELNIDSDEEDEANDLRRHSVDSGGRRSSGGNSSQLHDVCVDEVLPVGGALFFLGAHSLYPNCRANSRSRYGEPDGTRLARLDGRPLCFHWDALDNDARQPCWLARGTALRMRVDELYAEWQELGPIQQGRLVGRVLAPPLKEFLVPVPGAKITHSSTIRVSDRQEMLTSKMPENSELKQQGYETHLGSKDLWPQYVSKDTKRPYCSWVGCRKEYDRDSLLERGLLPLRGNRQFFCSDLCRKSYTLRTDGSALRREAWERDQGVCVKCKLDTVKLVKHIEHLDCKERRRALVRAGFQPDRGFTEARLIRLSRQTEWHSGIGCNLWEADHRLRVASGGGECDGDNIDTLCLRCHGRKSYQENKAARLAKKATGSGKKQKRIPRRIREPQDNKDSKSHVFNYDSDSDAFDDRKPNHIVKPRRRRKTKGHGNVAKRPTRDQSSTTAKHDRYQMLESSDSSSEDLLAVDIRSCKQKRMAAVGGIGASTIHTASRQQLSIDDDSDSDSERVSRTGQADEIAKAPLSKSKSVDETVLASMDRSSDDGWKRQKTDE